MCGYTWSCWLAIMLFGAPIAWDLLHTPRYNLMLCPRPQSAALKNKQKKQGKVGYLDVYWSLATLETKAPKVGAETVSGGRLFQSLTVQGKNELRR